MKDWPTDPMLQHHRFIAAMCEDIVETGRFSLGGAKASRVAEINRQVNTREPAQPNKRAGRNS